MLQYLENFLILSSTIDIFNFHSNEIRILEDLVSKKSFYYLFQETLKKFISDVFKKTSLRRKKLDFIKFYYLKMISTLFSIWINPFVFNSNNVTKELKIKTITNFQKFIDMINLAVENIETRELWVSEDMDARIQNQQAICRSIIINDLYILYYQAIQFPASVSTSTGSSQSSVLSTGSTNNINASWNMNCPKKDFVKWKVKIISTCDKTPNSSQKQGHYNYLAKRFPNFSFDSARHCSSHEKPHMATLYFHKSPMYLPKYSCSNLSCLPIISVREFNERQYLSTNGETKALIYDIYIELNNIDVKKIRHIYVYGVLDSCSCKRFVGFAFRNLEHFDKIVCKKRFNIDYKNH